MAVPGDVSTPEGAEHGVRATLAAPVDAWVRDCERRDMDAMRRLFLEGA